MSNIGWKNETTEYGFQFGNMIVSRHCENDGGDKRAKWAAIGIETPAGTWDIESDAKGNLTITKRTDAPNLHQDAGKEDGK